MTRRFGKICPIFGSVAKISNPKLKVQNSYIKLFLIVNISTKNHVAIDDNFENARVKSSQIANFAQSGHTGCGLKKLSSELKTDNSLG